MEPVPLLRCFDVGIPNVHHRHRDEWVAIGVAIGNPLLVVSAPPRRTKTQSAQPRPPLTATQFMKGSYPDSKSDLFAGFIERCSSLAGSRGAVAMITMQSWMFLSSYEKLRASLLLKQRITSMLHLGARAFDSIGGEVVSSTAFVLANVPPEKRGAAERRAGTFVRLVDGASEAEKVAGLTKALEVRASEVGFHLASDADFTAVPGSPIVYWLSEKMRAAFKTGRPLGDVAEPNQGLITADNDRFLICNAGLSRGRSEAPPGRMRGGASWVALSSGLVG